MNVLHYHASLQAYTAANSIDELITLSRAFAGQLGFSSFIYALRVPRTFSNAQVLALNGYPQGWVEHYFARHLYDVDPVIQHCSRHILPVAWHDMPVPGNADTRAMMGEAAEYGLKSGTSMPIHCAHGELGIWSVACDSDSVAARRQAEAARPFLMLMAGHVHEAVRRVYGLDAPGVPVTLTAREQECLRWVADGKTSWEISRLLRTAERTINFHLANAMVKLGVSNRQHAVAKAVLLGLLQPSPF